MPKSKDTGVVVVSADGGSRGNPGPAAVGAVLYGGNGKKIAEISRYIGEATNNVAEYLAVIYGLQEALVKNARKVRLRVDSQLVARQLKGDYRVKDRKIRVFFDLASSLAGHFDRIEIEEIPREDNSEADLLVNRALDIRRLL